MPSTLTCPDEAELLALAMGEPVAAEVAAHVADCATCQVEARSSQGRGGDAPRQSTGGLFSSSTSSETLPRPGARRTSQVDDVRQ